MYINHVDDVQRLTLNFHTATPLEFFSGSALHRREDHQAIRRKARAATYLCIRRFFSNAIQIRYEIFFLQKSTLDIFRAQIKCFFATIGQTSMRIHCLLLSTPQRALPPKELTDFVKIRGGGLLL